MIRLLRCYRPDGETRAVWTDQAARTLRAHGVVPRRASNVEVVEEGPHRGRFHVDLTRISKISGNPKHCVCLLPAFDSYADAVRAEVAWLERNWVLGD